MNATAVSPLTSRRSILGLGLAAAVAPLTSAGAALGTALEVWKDANCGCCEGWVQHMRAAGFQATVHDVGDLAAIKSARSVPDTLQSCHTAVVDGYVIEGHVPAGDVRRLLLERPRAVGLAAPGMPPSSPGMDIPGTPYQVVVFGGAGGNRVWARH
ncbi:DUF411 domain-containing protein [Roseomonas sp. KE2513]|uniref:DUF411 domain-containing protein n=1 Tax=Roseomonas sp. KE2513 TaxID=2479202 RepID=UPI0018E038F7|nr:DUF411 domain-containing protein [Roseomonas sp. KE2513]MBI0539686.1 DUF411 domain-containing protein [Roseomonas sp. KE2513]